MRAQTCLETINDCLPNYVAPLTCKRCDETGKSCCRVPQTEQGMLPPLSMAEINRIVMYSGLGGVGGREFAVRRSNSELFVQKMVDLFPDQLNGVYRVFPIHGQHYELLIEDERCTFHGPCGCELPRDVRPLFCRLYPFWFYGPDPYVFANDQCLALGECRTVQELCLALGTNLEHLHGLYAQLLLNWGFYPEQRLQAAN